MPSTVILEPLNDDDDDDDDKKLAEKKNYEGSYFNERNE